MFYSSLHLSRQSSSHRPWRRSPGTRRWGQNFFSADPPGNFQQGRRLSFGLALVLSICLCYLYIITNSYLMFTNSYLPILCPRPSTPAFLVTPAPDDVSGLLRSTCCLYPDPGRTRKRIVLDIFSSDCVTNRKSVKPPLY